MKEKVANEMSKQIKIFQNEEFGQVRVLEINGEPWLVGKDVAEALGYADSSSAVSKNVDSDDKTTLLLQQDGSNYKSKTTVINESGLYSLILSSKLPTAKKFKRWVTSEVLPSIRKTGSYTNKPTCIEDVLISSLQEMKALKGEVQAIKQETVKTKEEIQGIRDVVAINSADWKTDCKNLITKIAYKLGGIGHIQDVYKEVYSTLDKRLGISLSTRLTNKRRRMADEGVCKSRRDKLNYVDVIADDKKLIEGYIALVKELSIKYGVA